MISSRVVGRHLVIVESSSALVKKKCSTQSI